MIRWRFFPFNKALPMHLYSVISIFEECEEQITSESKRLQSNAVLKEVASKFAEQGYQVESGHKKEDIIEVPVLFGEQGKPQLSFHADCYNAEYKTVIEIEAGQAVDNYKFLKDFFEGCMMYDIEYLVIAVKATYRTNKFPKGKRDYEKVCKFFEAMYVSERIGIPLKGLLIVGY